MIASTNSHPSHPFDVAREFARLYPEVVRITEVADDSLAWIDARPGDFVGFDAAGVPVVLVFKPDPSRA